jgi:uncharacterized phage infection (PIP) family protein YhgE
VISPVHVIDFGYKSVYPGRRCEEKLSEEGCLLMDSQTLDQLEARIEELTDRFLELREGHQKAAERLSQKEEEVESLNMMLKESKQTNAEAQTRIEKILKRLEFLKNRSE